MALTAFMVHPVFPRKYASIYPFIFNIADKWTDKENNNMEPKQIMEKFEGKNMAAFSPGDELPGGWVECVATWPAAVEWQDHPQVKAYKRRGKFVGWDRKGHKLWTGEG
tara:strand:- start:161 stop:487 length:327 start_codon:yes stop_codon:yes gene_type:complete